MELKNLPLKPPVMMEADIMENIDFIFLIYYIWRLLLETLELDGQGRCSGKLQSKVLCSNVCVKSVKIQENSEKMGGGLLSYL